MAAHDREIRPNFQTLLLAALTALSMCYGAVGVARQAASLAPRVGDIIMFDPARPAGFDSNARLTVARPGGEACLLDAGAIRRTGGSLMLEQRGPDRLFRVHWAGLRTSEDPHEDCGEDSDLVLTVTDMNALATASGGFGVDHTSLFRPR